MNENNWYIKGNFFPEQFSDDPAFRMRFRATLWAHRTRIPPISSLHTLGVLELAGSTLGSNLIVEDVRRFQVYDVPSIDYAHHPH